MQEENVRIGNYEVLQHIADGAFGRVFLVRQWFFKERLYALKLLQTKRLQSTREQNRFMQEARFLGMLLHPHIPYIHDIGIDVDGTPYLVLEYAPNGSLRDLINSYAPLPIPFEQAISILSGVEKALSFTHQHGVVHHDIKPENILFNSQWEAMLTDFGIALVMESVIVRRSAATVGTPDYMAPEQYQGYASRRSDQYSLAVMTYELFTGRVPFLANSTDELRNMHQSKQPIPPSQFNSTLPRYIDHVMLKALEKRRINRFDDVRSFVRALQGAPVAPAQRQSVISDTRTTIRVR
jgi:serine/threonine protein kinase